MALKHGNTHIRAFADVDSKARLEGVKALLKAREEFKGKVELQVVAFPQDGVIREPGTEELVRQAVLKAQEQVRADASVSASNRNREIVSRLWKGNIFQIKDAVQIVARELELSPNTVYMHLRRMRENPPL